MTILEIRKLQYAGVYSLAELAVLIALSENDEPMSTVDIHLRANMPHGTAFAILRRLEGHSLVEHHGSRPKPSKWILTQSGREFVKP
jgi:DNA-binding MarR family transcriptional regulator